MSFSAAYCIVADLLRSAPADPLERCTFLADHMRDYQERMIAQQNEIEELGERMSDDDVAEREREARDEGRTEGREEERGEMAATLEGIADALQTNDLARVRKLLAAHDVDFSIPEVKVSAVISPTYSAPRSTDHIRVRGVSGNVLRVMFGAHTPADAYALYLRASLIDEEPARFAEAASLYEQAFEIDPALAIALTNLGNIRVRQGRSAEAKDLYTRVLAIDPMQPEANYNLGWILLDGGDVGAAIPWLRTALDADPKFADAAFNLAMAHQQMGKPAVAANYWHMYLDLEPTGAWADIARGHLGVPNGKRRKKADQKSRPQLRVVKGRAS